MAVPAATKLIVTNYCSLLTRLARTVLKYVASMKTSSAKDL
jgi:hypothetical protein